jgi:NAD(P)-dependent dehydrogenase (short-subunit alcohol dehydrogenase family)
VLTPERDPTTLEFDGDVIIVTGAGGGMGRVHALDLARRGARVVVNDLGGSPFGGSEDPSLAEAVVEEIRAFGGEAIPNTRSVADPEGAASLTQTAMQQWGRLDAVVSNAAIAQNTPFDEMTLAEVDAVLDVNLRGSIAVLHPAYKAMKAGGGGRIVAVTSTAGLLGAYGMTGYAASKTGLLGLVRTLALEGAAHGIRANLIAPGASGTRMSEALAAQRAQRGDLPAVVDKLPDEMFRRLAPEVITPMVVALAHRSCPFTAQIMWAWAGAYGRASVMLNRGWSSGGGATAEDVIAHWGEICSLATAEDAEPDVTAYAMRTMPALLSNQG